MAELRVKRVYEPPSESDGVRVLVDRLWPRGLTKKEATLDAWLRDLAPSNELRKWFHAHPEQWPEFRKRYIRELGSPAAAEAGRQLHEFFSRGAVTLLFASKNTDENNATVLREFLLGKKKEPARNTGVTKTPARQPRRAK